MSKITLKFLFRRRILMNESTDNDDDDLNMIINRKGL